MSIRIKDRDVGDLAITPKGDSVEVNIRGLLGTAEVFRALRGIPGDEDLRHFSEERVQRVIVAAKEGLKDVDSYLERGGVIIRGSGGLWIYNEFADADAADPELARWGHKRIKASQYYPRSSFEGNGPLAKSANGEYYIAAPDLVKRLRVVRAPQGTMGKKFQDYKVSLPGDRIKDGFVEGMSVGLRNRFKDTSEDLGADLIFVGGRVAESRIYDHARGQVPGLEEL